ncbi:MULTISPECIES: hypothetical protein [unclassified Mesorhizobium]|uniref:hypothetical protein n=1 Tax=unclassified Mesorhizobium TaxID=325217 RepID=UPI000FCA5681|nr:MULTISPECIES: hypothetical protein [unclassified Mesorhizobium]RUX91681.1 hypothetical protein EN993_26110 [Mesorhizobium sp. M7D.F.Ca.US.004.01.2.1]RVA33225.1 hypothetical protein EN935_09700 [Mesorhizobium sp. M7D.F.Ca.US.004.03.1.1]
MSKKLKAAIIAALVALAAGFAISNGLISQQTADEIKARTDQVLTEEAAQPAPQPASDNPPAPSTEPAPQAPSPLAGAQQQESQQGQ